MDREMLRARLTHMLGIPSARVPLDPEPSEAFQWDGILVEHW